MSIDYIQNHYRIGTILLHKDKNYLCKVMRVYVDTSKYGKLPYTVHVQLHNGEMLARDIEDFVIYDPKIHSNATL